MKRTFLILLLAVLVMIYTRPLPIVWYIAPMLLGMSIGIICSRFLLFFVKLSRHCKRGTSQSTFFLAWETGITLGLALGYALFYDHREQLFYVAISLTLVSLLFYHFHTHNWFLNHKNR